MTLPNSVFFPEFLRASVAREGKMYVGGVCLETL